MKQDNSSSGRIPPFALIAAALICLPFCIAFYNNNFRAPYLNPTPIPGSSITLGVQELVALSHTTGEPYESIIIYTDAFASRILYPAYSRNTPIATTDLTATEMAEIEQLRSLWCHDHPTFTPHQGEAFYDLAIRCTGISVVQARVSPESLPIIVAQIRNRLLAQPFHEPLPR